MIKILKGGDTLIRNILYARHCSPVLVRFAHKTFTNPIRWIILFPSVFTGRNRGLKKGEARHCINTLVVCSQKPYFLPQVLAKLTQKQTKIILKSICYLLSRTICLPIHSLSCALKLRTAVELSIMPLDHSADFIMFYSTL